MELEIKKIAKKIGRRSIIKDVSLSINKGEIVGLLGPNGAGKTTIFKTIMGFIIPDKGNIFFEEKDITRLPVYQKASLGLSYLFQEPAIFNKLTVMENLLIILENFYSKQEQKKQAEYLLDKMGIIHLKDSIATYLSGGEKRRLEIARNLINNPKIFLLDEPFSIIDPKTVFEIKTMIKQLKIDNVGILITDHNVRDALSIIDRAYLIHNGEIIIQGTPEEILKNPLSRQVYFGENFSP
ncbi:MAG: LPS export ABC transporter ATP-binding protein [Candidatus Omnitrophica bacterium]|nr:LPS export ABC transporter ATP-binding protein [Candidatus Omnitrophota bacterium]